MSSRWILSELRVFVLVVVVASLVAAAMKASVEIYWRVGIDDKVQAAIEEHERKAHP